MPGFPVHHQFPEPAQTHVRHISDTIQPSNPLSSPSPPTLNLSQHNGLFQWVGSSNQVAKVLEFQLQNIGPSNEHPGLMSFRMDWLDLLAVQGTLKSLLQHHSSKASILWCSALYYTANLGKLCKYIKYLEHCLICRCAIILSSSIITSFKIVLFHWKIYKT